MGMYDEITFKCKSCGESIIEQSKDGLCELKDYHQRDVPADIAVNLLGNKLTCPRCHTHYTIFGDIPKISLHLKTKKLERNYD